MNAPGWERIKEVFQDALERPPHDRAQWLRARCGDDRALQAEVESLLATHEQAGSFADQPSVDVLNMLAAESHAFTSVGRALHAGDRLGVYEIRSLLGVGGMGEVYKALDTRLDRLVAIKVLPAHFAADRDRYERFTREARAIASLDHAHICSLYDVGEHDGCTSSSCSISRVKPWRPASPTGRCRSNRRCAMPSRSPTHSTMPIAAASSIAISSPATLS